jgi:hypothetical protein
MRLPETRLSLQDSLLEFDVWITPTLGEIRDTDRFRQEMDRVAEVFDALETATNSFGSIEDCKAAKIAETIGLILKSRSAGAVPSFLQAFCSVLFLVTGKSDNNAKCQLPIFLRDNAKWRSIPVAGRHGGTVSAVDLSRFRELKAEKFVGIVDALRDHPELQTKLLEVFVRFILSDNQYVSQLWSIGRSYAMLKALNRERDLLSPLVVFQVRGSVAASGGHEPEGLLRKTMADWGLEGDIDFNLSDAVVSKEGGDLMPVEGAEIPAVRAKTRAYDFVLPFRTPGWKPRIFVQCQFYAGDSGSVSHKNVDQTSSSRASVSDLVGSAVFVEYVDGAGYFSSLNGDLKTLLSMPTTKSFIQVRSAPIRLRRELQSIGFVLPIEIEHAILRCDGIRKKVETFLAAEGYGLREIVRAVERCLQRGFIARRGRERLDVERARLPLVRRYVLLDTIACEGSTIEASGEKLSGFLLVPGYGPLHGLKMDEAVSKALRVYPRLKADWSNPEVLLGDIRWLCEAGLAISS